MQSIYSFHCPLSTYHCVALFGDSLSIHCYVNGFKLEIERLEMIHDRLRLLLLMTMTLLCWLSNFFLVVNLTEKVCLTFPYHQFKRGLLRFSILYSLLTEKDKKWRQTKLVLSNRNSYDRIIKRLKCVLTAHFCVAKWNNKING